MQRRDFIKTGIMGTGMLVGAGFLGASQSPSPKSKRHRLYLDYEIHVASSKQTKMWIPLPLATNYQQPSNLRVRGNYTHLEARDTDQVPMLHVVFDKQEPVKRVQIQVDVRQLDANSAGSNPQDLARFLEPTRYIIINAETIKQAKELAGLSAKQSVDRYYAWAKEHGTTATFVSLCRSAGIPAREVQGFELGHQLALGVKAEVFLPNEGWVRYDLQGARNSKLDGRGRWIGDFVALNFQKDTPLDRFLIDSFNGAFALIDGDNLAYYDASYFVQDLSYKTLHAV
ncbi:hypothetical protein HBZC1_12250 [Helicobacter bizzozeronii CIII-1]|uniref:Transglutaminase-like domain-containing protein n=1 Tax=Helicobacter bizzozeronii (strain CIII-1) TaxID=1002804 RepID=F8KTP1_HELBC|nr:transglutaminase-like domain-containing protein [Helicobacter bizzozeronii]CCB80211.1 hypothetical protein HBZC1_12250 [Helicobacter bizzozeronii CIII-1]